MRRKIVTLLVILATFLLQSTLMQALPISYVDVYKRQVW